MVITHNFKFLSFIYSLFCMSICWFVSFFVCCLWDLSSIISFFLLVFCWGTISSLFFSRIILFFQLKLFLPSWFEKTKTTESEKNYEIEEKECDLIYLKLLNWCNEKTITRFLITFWCYFTIITWKSTPHKTQTSKGRLCWDHNHELFPA